MSIEGQGHFSTLAQGCVHTKIQTGFFQKLLCQFEQNFYESFQLQGNENRMTLVLWSTVNLGLSKVLFWSLGAAIFKYTSVDQLKSCVLFYFFLSFWTVEDVLKPPPGSLLMTVLMR